jgi:acyl-[acyl-carrier-protein] desaturase
MSLKNVRLEVMNHLEKDVESLIQKYLIPVDTIWQPSDFLPDSETDKFYEEVKEIRALAKEMPYDFWVVLVGDMITEEALPTYESWLMDVEGVGQVERNSWSKWVRHWTAEEIATVMFSISICTCLVV